MRNIKLTIAYDGTNYHGFQEQCGTGLPTIQETLEWALGRLMESPIKVYGAGRTDAGVHARGQVVNFICTGGGVPTERIPLAANGLLPEDIVVSSAVEVPGDFHARFSAASKIYKYYIFNYPVPSPFARLYSLFEPRALDIGAMQDACGQLIGGHDFASFCAAGSTAKSTVREMYECKLQKEGIMVEITFVANGFLYNMVRILTGTLLQVGLGKIDSNKIRDILAARDRRVAGPTAPPHGLYLEEVKYVVYTI